jgi:hypothetical protein
MEEQEIALTHDEALELLAYLVSSAQDCLSESPDYGVFRLISGAERLARAWQPRCADETAPLLNELVTRTGPIGAARDIDPQGFQDYLAEMSREVAREIKRQAVVEAQDGA